eukprot:g48380.t1
MVRCVAARRSTCLPREQVGCPTGVANPLRHPGIHFDTDSRHLVVAQVDGISSPNYDPAQPFPHPALPVQQSPPIDSGEQKNLECHLTSSVREYLARRCITARRRQNHDVWPEIFSPSSPKLPVFTL